MEEEVDSRFVSNLNNQWTAEHGPLPKKNLVNWRVSLAADDRSTANTIGIQGANELTKAFQQYQTGCSMTWWFATQHLKVVLDRILTNTMYSSFKVKASVNGK